MHQLNRHHAQSEQFKGTVNADRLQERWMRILHTTFKYVAKSAQQLFQYRRAGVSGHYGTMAKMKTAQIVDTVDMVGMGMGKQHGIDLGYSLTQHLLPQIGASVNQDIPAARLDQQRGPRTLITRVCRATDRAVATHHRHAR